MAALAADGIWHDPLWSALGQSKALYEQILEQLEPWVGMNEVLLLIRFASPRTLASHLNTNDSSVPLSQLDRASSLISWAFLSCTSFIALLEVLSRTFPAEKIVGTREK